MCRAPSKLHVGVFNLLKSLETKGGVNVMQLSVPNDNQFALVGLYCRAKPKDSIYLRYKWADTAFWLCKAVYIMIWRDC